VATHQRSVSTNRAHAQAALAAVGEDVCVPEGAPGGMGAFRTALATSFLYKFLINASLRLAEGASPGAASDGESGGGKGEVAEQFAWVGPAERSAVAAAPHVSPKGVQFRAEAAPQAIVGQSTRHRAAHLQARLLAASNCMSCMQWPP
jgi:xanthine dehydrogenase/oxidase